MAQNKKIKVKDNVEVLVKKGNLKDYDGKEYATEDKVQELIEAALENVAKAESNSF